MDTTNLTGRMDLAASLEALRRRALDAVGAAASLDELDAVEADSVGRDSELAAFRRSLGTLPQDERPEAGRLINEVAKEIQGAVEARRGALAVAARAERIAAEGIDVTVDYEILSTGGLHLIQQVIDEVSDIFVGLGYHVAEGPEAELAWYNFDALNTPPHHPSRLDWDTMYVDYGKPEDEMLLRAHTSPIQARYMETHEPPVYIVAPGRA
jgi:phenylalanyl-tRNA synthetase alpha chain